MARSRPKRCGRGLGVTSLFAPLCCFAILLPATAYALEHGRLPIHAIALGAFAALVLPLLRALPVGYAVKGRSSRESQSVSSGPRPTLTLVRGATPESASPNS
jgi:hypothetical protein